MYVLDALNIITIVQGKPCKTIAKAINKIKTIILNKPLNDGFLINI
jgi:hypothetical protein